MADENKELREAKEDIRKGLGYRLQYGHDADWPQWRDYYQGKFPGTLLSVNLMYSNARAIIPRVYFRAPRIRISARNPRAEAGARVLEVVDNWLIQELGIKRQFKRILLDTILFGTGIAKLGFDSEFGFVPELMGVAEMGEGGEIVEHPDTTGTQLDAKGKRRIEYNADIVGGMPWLGRVHPGDFIIDPAADDIRNARWVAHRIFRTVDDVKADEKLSNKKDIQANRRMEQEARHLERMFIRADETGSRGDSTIPPVDSELVELWEYRDFAEQKIKVITLDHKKFLRNDIDELQIDGLPFESLVFNEDPDGFWGTSDSQLMLSQQLEINELRTQQVYARRAALSRFFARRGGIDPEEFDKFLSEYPNVGIWTNDDVDKVIKEWRPQLPLDQNLWGDVIRGDVREQIGMSRNQMGEFDKSTRRTATEANIVQAGAEIRVNERRDAVADLLVRTMRKINQMIFKYWSKPRIAKVAGPDLARHWVQYTGEDLRGEYDYEVNPDEALPVSTMSRRQDLMLLLQTLMPYVQAGAIPAQGIKELIKELLGQFEAISPERVLGESQGQGEGPMGMNEFSQLQSQQEPAFNPANMGGGQSSPNANVQPSMPGMSPPL